MILGCFVLLLINIVGHFIVAESPSSSSTSSISSSFYGSLTTSPPFTVYWLSECGCTGVEKESVALTAEIVKYFQSDGNGNDGSSHLNVGDWKGVPPDHEDLLRLKLNVCSNSDYESVASPILNDHHNDGRCPGYRREVKRSLFDMTKLYGLAAPIPPSSSLIPILFSRPLPVTVVVVHVTQFGLCGFPTDMINPLLAYNTLVRQHYSSLPSAPSVRPRPYFIARVFGESNNIDDASFHRCIDLFDELWVATRFYGEVLDRRIRQNSTIAKKNIVVLPKTIDMKVFDRNNPQISPMELFPSTTSTSMPSTPPFIFLSVFKWEPRKDWKTLLRAFLTAFPSPKYSHIKLYIHTVPFNKSRPMEAVREYLIDTLHIDPQLVEVILTDRILINVATAPLPESSLPSLYANSNCFVLCSHGEGWNLPLLEAMAMGLPVITLNFSGPTEFTHEDVVYYVKHSLTNVSDDVDRGSLSMYEEHGNVGQWAQVDVEDFQSILKYVVNEYEWEVKQRRAKSEEWVRKKFNMKRVGRMFASRLKEIEGEMKEKESERKIHEEL